MGATTVQRAFLLTDIDSSTAMFEADPVRMQAAVARHDALTAEAVTGAGGEVVKSTGDGALCAFPTVDAALAGAIALFRACAAEPWPTDGPLRLRAAVHHAPALARDGDYFGPTLNRTARLEAAGRGGQLLVPADALASGSLPDGVLVADLGEHRLRSVPDPIQAGHLVLGALVADQYSECEGMAYDPTRVVDGVVCSADPVLAARGQAYPTSATRRRAAYP